MTQIDIFQYEAEVQREEAKAVTKKPEPTWLVPRDLMPTEAWRVHDILEANIKRGNEWISMTDLATRASVSDRDLRDIIPLIIRKTYMKIISSNFGYKVADDEAEFMEFSKRQLSRATSSLQRCLDMGIGANVFYFLLNHHHKDTVAQGQTQIKFTGYELDIIRQFAEDYKIDLKGVI